MNRIDRVVHANNADHTVVLVRYERAGKWYVEVVGSHKRNHVTTTEAVDIAHQWWREGGTPHFGRPGGSRFDHLLRRKLSGMREGPGVRR